MDSICEAFVVKSLVDFSLEFRAFGFSVRRKDDFVLQDRKGSSAMGNHNFGEIVYSRAFQPDFSKSKSLDGILPSS